MNYQVSIEAELSAPGFLVQIGSFSWEQPLEVREHISTPALTLLLSPRHSYSQGYYSADGFSGSFHDVGTMILAPTGVNLHARASGGPIRLIHCSFDQKKFATLTGLDGKWETSRLRACLDIKNTRLNEILLRLGQEAFEPGLACGMLTESLGTLALVEIARHFESIDNHGKSTTQKLSSWQINRITQYVEGLADHMPDVSDIAELCGIGSRHLRRLFKETTNQTLYQYARDVWITKAKTMLSDTNLPLKEIAGRLGFSDPSSFSTAFRRATGEAPKAFRQQFRKPRVHASPSPRPSDGTNFHMPALL